MVGRHGDNTLPSGCWCWRDGDHEWSSLHTASAPPGQHEPHLYYIHTPVWCVTHTHTPLIPVSTWSARASPVSHIHTCMMYHIHTFNTCITHTHTHRQTRLTLFNSRHTAGERLFSTAIFRTDVCKCLSDQMPTKDSTSIDVDESNTTQRSSVRSDVNIATDCHLLLTTRQWLQCTGPPSLIRHNSFSENLAD